MPWTRDMPTVLIADDDARLRQALRQFVAGLAQEVWEASDGGEAVTACNTHRPDWVIMDWRMKPIDGLTATMHIKARFPATRVVLMSQDDDASLHREARRAGAEACILKEDLTQLAETLASVPPR